MRVRKTTATGDYRFGSGRADYWQDVPDAPAQLCVSRLRLERGEWFLDRAEGINYRGRVLGKRTERTRDPEIRSRILGTQGVKSITAYGSVQNRDTRGFSVTATINTAYGAKTFAEPL